jgi:hypothetical protein
MDVGENEWTEHITRGEVELMLERTVSAPLARIETRLAAMETNELRNDSNARESVRNRTDWIAPVLASIISTSLAVLAHKMGAF